jgi:hypothetical protein
MSPFISSDDFIPDDRVGAIPHLDTLDHVRSPEVRQDPGGGTPPPTPPLLTGGVKQTYTKQGAYFDLLFAQVDGLTITVPTDVGEDLRRQLDHVQTGYASDGFAQSDRYMIPGGFAWRKFSPHQPSKEWGTGYESWDVLGHGSEWLAHRLVSSGGRPSRIDYAFDFRCPDWLYPAHVVDVPGIREHCSQKGIRIEHSGCEVSGSKYIGAASSDRRINVYRRDLKHTHLLADIGPHVRVELRLHKKHAAAFYSATLGASREPAPLASTHIADMMHYATLAETDPIPPISEPDLDRDFGNQLALFVDQNASLLEIALHKNCDLYQLALLRLQLSSRASKFRHEKRQIHYEPANGDEATSFAARILAAKCGRGD